MKKTGFLGMFLVVCCLWITSCSREELVIEQPEGKQQEAEEAGWKQNPENRSLQWQRSKTRAAGRKKTTEKSG